MSTRRSPSRRIACGAPGTSATWRADDRHVKLGTTSGGSGGARLGRAVEAPLLLCTSWLMFGRMRARASSMVHGPPTMDLGGVMSCGPAASNNSLNRSGLRCQLWPVRALCVETQVEQTEQRSLWVVAQFAQ